MFTFLKKETHYNRNNASYADHCPTLPNWTHIKPQLVQPNK